VLSSLSLSLPPLNTVSVPIVCDVIIGNNQKAAAGIFYERLIKNPSLLLSGKLFRYKKNFGFIACNVFLYSLYSYLYMYIIH